MTVYTMTSKATGEQYEVVPHTFGDGYVDFAPLSNAGTEDWMQNSKLTRFDNIGSQGNLTNNDYTIVLNGEQNQLPTETESVEAPVEVATEVVDETVDVPADAEQTEVVA